MLGLLAFIGGLFALVWTTVVASVGLVILFVLLLPLLIVALFFRIGFVFLKVVAAFVLLSFVCAWLI